MIIQPSLKKWEFDPVLANNTPYQIFVAAREGKAKELWNVGDTIPIHISGRVSYFTIDGTYLAVIIGFDHNAEIEGNNTIHFQIGKNESGIDIAFCDNGYNTGVSSEYWFQMVRNQTDNSGGWESSYMRNTICNDFFNALPEEWQTVIKPCRKYSDNTGGGIDSPSYMTSTTDKIWLLSSTEVFGDAAVNCNSAEKEYTKQYDYYVTNSKIRYKHNDTGRNVTWWCRSVDATDAERWCSAFNNQPTTNPSYMSSGLSPGFKIG